MRLLLLTGLFIILVLAPGTLSAQSTKITLNLVNVPLNDVLNEIEKKSDYTFLVNQEVVDVTRKVDAVFVNTSIKDILDQLFKGEKVNFVTSDHQIIISPYKTKGGDFQPKKVTGKVTDEITGETLIGVTVQIKGTTMGTTTSIDGSYTIEILSPDAILVFSYLGYEPKEFSVKDAVILNVAMRQIATQLESVIVTALGIKREEKALGYAVQKVEGQSLKTIKMADATTALTGKVAGLGVWNSSNFGTESTLSLRGKKPLIVVDGVPSDNISINDISSDDIKSIDVLKGATASALYGVRGAGGAIMVTTIRGDKNKGLSVSINSSTMFNAGYITFPETQTSYSSGFNSKYGNDYVWGDKLDIGRTTTLWNPFTMEWQDSTLLVSKGKNNLKNFQEQGYILNNNISIVSQGEHGSLRSSFTHIFQKGQYPNQKLNKMTYSLGGDMSFDKFSLESNFSYTKHSSPNIRGNQYSGGFLYNLIGWLGAEWDVQDYKNYWMVKDEQQNWFNEEWYDNPYFLANEVITTSDRDIYNGFVSATYKFYPWMKLSLRSGFDSYINRSTSRNPISSRNSWSSLGFYDDTKYTGYSLNNDLILAVDKSLGNFKVEGILGGTIYFAKDDYFDAYTQGGISIPGFYSLKASVNPIGWDISMTRKQINSLYSRISLSWKSLAYLDVTGRNDWASTLEASTRSYFYPSVGGSFVVSEIFPKVSWLDMWKFRGSWTVSKAIPSIYETNKNYTVNNDVWSGYNSAYYPTDLKSLDAVRPATEQTFELGTAVIFFKNKLHADFTVFQTRTYDILASGPLSDATGFSSTYVNTQTEYKKKGLEVMLGGTPIQTKDWKWDINLNWSKAVMRYSKIDAQYDADQPWVKVGERVDAYTTYDWIRDEQGNLVNNNGFPIRSDYESVVGYTGPDWIWGLNSTLKYKSFSMSFSVDGRVGGSSFSRIDALLWNSGAHIGTDTKWRYDEVVNGLTNYVGPGVKVVSGTVEYDSYGKITSDTREFAPNDVQVSYESYMKDGYYRGAWSWCTQDILDETFVKLRELSFSYQVPDLFVKKIKMKDLSVSLVGQNLLYWGKEYKMTDPDGGGTNDLVSPSVRYLGLNLKCTF